MLKLLKRRRAPSPAIPDDERVYAIGDIHGRDDLLAELLASIDIDLVGFDGTYQLIFLGDLIDRGAASAAVVARTIALARERPCRFIAGNHEELLLSTCNGDTSAIRTLDRAGGRETLLSYGVDADLYDGSSLDELTDLFAEHVDPAHRAFMAGFEDVVVVGDYAFVHAGIRPGIALENQTIEDLRWIRGEFLRFAGAHPKVIVHGHTITTAPELRTNRIGIDTGAYQSGVLTALVLQGADRKFIATGTVAPPAAAR